MRDKVFNIVFLLVVIAIYFVLNIVLFKSDMRETFISAMKFLVVGFIAGIILKFVKIGK